MDHRDLATLEAGLAAVRGSPSDRGVVELIVCRPGVDERQVMGEAVLDEVRGLIGNDWYTRGSRHTPDGSAEIAKQVTLMNARAAALIAGPVERWPLAGDQLYVDFDLSGANVPPGTRLQVGTAVLEVTDSPHRGCAKFSSRYGPDALRFVRSQVGGLNLRGIHTRVVTGGTVSTGDEIRTVRG
jgi:hypothetical protein